MLRKEFQLLPLKDITHNHLFLFTSRKEYDEIDIKKYNVQPMIRAIKVLVEKKENMVTCHIYGRPGLVSFPWKSDNLGHEFQMTIKDIIEHYLTLIESNRKLIDLD
jgi:hypothetical protein